MNAPISMWWMRKAYFIANVNNDNSVMKLYMWESFCMKWTLEWCSAIASLPCKALNENVRKFQHASVYEIKVLTTAADNWDGKTYKRPQNFNRVHFAFYQHYINFYATCFSWRLVAEFWYRLYFFIKIINCRPCHEFSTWP